VSKEVAMVTPNERPRSSADVKESCSEDPLSERRYVDRIVSAVSEGLDGGVGET